MGSLVDELQCREALRCPGLPDHPRFLRQLPRRHHADPGGCQQSRPGRALHGRDRYVPRPGQRTAADRERLRRHRVARRLRDVGEWALELAAGRACCVAWAAPAGSESCRTPPSPAPRAWRAPLTGTKLPGTTVRYQDIPYVDGQLPGRTALPRLVCDLDHINSNRVIALIR
jgi:hypothetical protein